MTDWTAFTVSLTDHVARVTLIGPGKGNVMGRAFWTELPQVFAELDDDPQVRAVVLAGSGTNFSFGLDLAEMGGEFTPLMTEQALAGPRSRFHSLVKSMQAAVTAVAESRVPVIAAVQGWCVGGGVDLIAAADIRYAAPDAKFSVREAKIGIVADIGSLQRLPPIIGEGHLRELAYTGKDIDAERAAAINLVNDVVTDPLATAHATAQEIAANPPLVVQGVKDVLDRERAAVVADGLKYVSAWNAAFLPSKDLVEGIAAVFEKRAPTFRGE
ncbi:crotonase/enoyl-CoA hydratase family protein [Williamsia sp. CHRR-6]|uniref:crotonase/enoyl-CoA hydratase family protein n=1 Tax=Williamsia sp. CHRR-6 TaxID=2835871 RepID=UPI001BD9F997|nr:crotonase/enoyl-CoA hydratase family protein [Williamsia sp. CHRR-6]MBT0565453.1 crotonase/enoyl-CoA hydratase family protein [Williamsia sp. CHRR-6]